jgi:photosystem II stability/assembly factor-like uncharacterized protein
MQRPSRARGSLVVAAVAALGLLRLPWASAAADSATPSAIGDVEVSWIAISPAFPRTGLVVLVGSRLTGCSQDCLQLWRSRDGGSTWTRPRAAGWSAIEPVVAVDGTGHEALFGAGRGGLQRSDDTGDTWSVVGNSGRPAVSPAYATDRILAVAGDHDYILRGPATQPVVGSGGTLHDLSFALAPGYPSAGGRPAALLGAADSSGSPVVETCTAQLSCSSPGSLPGASGPTFSPVELALSGGYADDGVVYAATVKGLFKATDGGHSFLPLDAPSPPGTAGYVTPALALAPGYRENGPEHTTYVAVQQIVQSTRGPSTHGGVYRSDDGGRSWVATGPPSSPLRQGATAVAAAPGGRIFAGYLTFPGNIAGLLCSPDGGASWGADCPPIARAAASAPPAPGGAGTGPAPQRGVANQGGVQPPGPTPAVGTTAPSDVPTAVARTDSGATGRSYVLPTTAAAVTLLAILAVLQRRRARRMRRR